MVEQFFQLARRIEPEMTNKSNVLIKEYFLVCRRRYQYRMLDLHAMVCFARSHCRLHFRNQVSQLDALVGIMCLEEKLANEGRTSALGFQVKPHDALNVEVSCAGSTPGKRFASFQRLVVGVIQNS